MAAFLNELITFTVLIIDFHFTVDSYTLKLYPFGTDAGDKTLPVEDDSTSQRISTPEFPFFGKNFTALYVNENGIISFGAKIRSPDTSPAGFPLRDKTYAAAPYWADVYTKRGGNVWYRVTSENVTVARIIKDIQRAFPHYPGFVASWAAIATWNEVTFLGASEIYLQKKNTFQVLIASNGHMSFVGFLYDKLSWTTGTLHGGNRSGLGGRPAKVGFSYGNSYYQLNVSGTDDVLTLVSTTNCGRPGVWFFRVDDVETIDDKICESEESVSVYPHSGSLPSGSSILVTGLCYRPDSDFLCDFGEAGTVKGQNFNDANAVCAAPLFTATRKEVEVYFYPSDVTKWKFAKVFILEPINFYHASVQLIEYPTSWTTGSRVQISWNPDELADRPITVQIINLADRLGTIQVHSMVTVVSEQENVGKAEFDLPELNNTSKDPVALNQLQMIRVQSLVRDGYKYVSKHWIWSDVFLLTSTLLANKSCLHWIKDQSEVVQFHNKGYKSLSLCPKTRRQLLADKGRFTACDLYYNPTMDSCYRTRTQSDEKLEQECCYDKEGELTRGPPCDVTNRTKSHQTAASLFSMFRENVVPYLECCVFSDNCFKYRDLGMPVNDSRYIPPSIGASFGDPHILTLDGVEYTFNGYGEYTVLNANNSEFLLQGRMQPLNGGQGTKSPATGFTAFAMKQRGGSTIQVHQDISRSVLVLFIDGVEKVIDFGHELQTTGVLIRNSSRGNYPRVVLAFICGITVYVENAAVLQMAVTVPVEFKGKTKGLLGYWNDNTDEEYLLPNGEFLSTDSTMSQVHHYFGQRWTTTEIESLFTYGPSEHHANHFDSSYVPTFMEAYDPILAKMNTGARKRALRTCEHSFQCIFDIAVTGRVDIGEDTNDFQKWLLKMKRNLHDEGCNAVLTLESGSVQTDVDGGVIIHHFRCNQDYVMVGKDRISCRGGVWDGSRPRCYKEASIMCKSLDISFRNGTFEGQGNKFGDRYTFKCDLPFALIGNDEIICGKDGLWTGQVPVCQRKQPRMASSRQTTVTPVIIIGVVVSIVALFIIVLTIWLVRKHRRRDAAKSTGTETPENQEGVAV